ncbi:type VII secretion integral membrane protein EccD [Amycolatopsis sp. NPDC059021]|uniref:type VII secretion integral membrane protein EccD n=1 Tax=Amycolatopsis sp. NPDC059021 TaxID=3346704 RepID=UPI003670EE03
MSSVREAELCRVSVFGPKGRADLAVPLGTTVASLLPVLLARAGDAASGEAARWVLQRLGEAPMDPAGTPESLEWRDGDELHLRLAEDALPELDFDDVADGLATTVARHPGRWRPEFDRWLFLGFSIAALVVPAVVLLLPGAPVLAIAGAGGAAVLLLVAAVLAGGRTEDGALTALCALGGCGFAALAGALAPAGVTAALDLRALPILIGSLTLAGAGAVLLVARAVWATGIPFVASGTVVATGLAGALAQGLHLGLGWAPARTAGLLATVLLAVLIFAPRIAVRFARIRGPQLPRTADELQHDIDPVPAAEMAEKARYADGYLTIATLASSMFFGCSFPFLVIDGVFGAVTATVLAIAVVLRSKAFLGSWQRVPLAVSGAAGLAIVVVAVAAGWTGTTRLIAVLVLAVVFAVLVAAMTRLPPRRPLPIWGHLANWLETLSAVAMIPLVLQLFGVYAWALGLAR